MSSQVMKTLFFCVLSIAVWETAKTFNKIDVLDESIMTLKKKSSVAKSKERNTTTGPKMGKTTTTSWRSNNQEEENVSFVVLTNTSKADTTTTTSSLSNHQEEEQQQQQQRGEVVAAAAVVVPRENDATQKCWFENVFGPVPPQFSHVSQHMCRHRGVTNLGDESMFHALALRLSRGLPINVVVFGGSVCQGDCIGGHTRAFQSHLMRFLNEAYPPIPPHNASSSSAEQPEHKLTKLCAGATGSNQAWEIATKHRSAVRDAHLFLVDKGSNDIEDSELKGSWKQEGHSRGSESIKFWTEALVRELRTWAPTAALVWIETSWRLHHEPNCQDKVHQPCKAPFHVDAAHTHLEVLEYYDVMQISMFRLLGPYTSAEHRAEFDKTYFCDPYHPQESGHKLIASAIGQVLNDRFEREKENGMQLPIEDESSSLSTATPPSPSKVPLPAPMILNPKDLKFLDAKPPIDLDFTDPSVVDQTLMESSSSAWKYATDLPSKPQTLMVTTTTNPPPSGGGGDHDRRDECAVLKLGRSPGDAELFLLRMKFLFSYEGFGTARVELFESRDNVVFYLIAGETVNCKWASKTSQIWPVELDLRHKNTPGSELFLKVCLDNENSAPEDRKLKLFGVALY